jgi:hypothetical protein
VHFPRITRQKAVLIGHMRFDLPTAQDSEPRLENARLRDRSFEAAPSTHFRTALPGG